MLYTVLFIIFALIIWFLIDLTFGHRQLRNHTPEEIPLRKGDVTFYSEGSHFFESLFDAIGNANDHIHVNFYIFRNDTLGKETLNRMKRKALQGVEIRLLVDYLGSRKLPKKVIKELRQFGIEFAFSQKPQFPYWFYTLNRRNHRKITVIDGHVGFIGGFNVGDEYLGKNPNLGDWRDYHLKIEGDGVQDLQKQFLSDWQAATKGKTEGSRYYPGLKKGSVSFGILPTNGSGLEKKFLQLIHRARKSITIGSPYYVPGQKIQQALIAARKRGVNVKILLPLKKDHPLVHQAAVPYFKPLLSSHCKVYQFYQGFYHAKVLVIDEKLAVLGTANLDRRSFVLNNEISCFIHDENMVNLVIDALKRDFARSQKVRLEQLKNRSIGDRILEGVATSISGLL